MNYKMESGLFQTEKIPNNLKWFFLLKNISNENFYMSVPEHFKIYVLIMNLYVSIMPTLSRSVLQNKIMAFF